MRIKFFNTVFISQTQLLIFLAFFLVLKVPHRHFPPSRRRLKMILVISMHNIPLTFANLIYRIGANASFGYILSQRVNLLLNIILPKPNVDVHTLYLDGLMGTANDPSKILEAEYRTDVTKIVTGIKGNVSNFLS